MSLFSDYIDGALKGVPDAGGSLERYKKQILKEMELQADSPAYKNMSEEEILAQLKANGFGSLKSDYRKYYEAACDKKRSRAVGASVALGSVAYILALIVVYISVSFITHLWSYTWLILFGGITLLLAGLLIYSVKKALVRGRGFGFVARFLSAIVVMLVSTFVFLCLQLIFHLPHSWIVFLVGVIAIFVVDAVFMTLLKQKHKIVNYIFYIPVVATLLYVVLGSLHIVPWNPGWLMIIVSLIIDIIVIIVSLIRKSSYIKKESDDVWSEN